MALTNEQRAHNAQIEYESARFRELRENIRRALNRLNEGDTDTPGPYIQFSREVRALYLDATARTRGD